MTISELIDRAHAQAKKSGFWDKERNTGELLMLIVSECGEALEAHRKGKRADLASFDLELKPTLAHLNGGAIEFREQAESAIFKETFRAYIKDTFEDELSDIAIRIADYCGSNNMTAPIDFEIAVMAGIDDASVNVGEALLAVVMTLVSHVDGETRVEPLGAMLSVFDLAKVQGINLWKHIELKMAYNKTREKLHGKAY